MPTHAKKCQLFDSLLQIKNYRGKSLQIMSELFCLSCFCVQVVLFSHAVKLYDAHDSRMPSFHQFQSCIPYVLNVHMKAVIKYGRGHSQEGEREALASSMKNGKIMYKTARCENIFRASSKKMFSLIKTIAIVKKLLPAT